MEKIATLRKDDKKHGRKCPKTKEVNL